jgi:hypothetical protein
MKLGVRRVKGTFQGKAMAFTLAVGWSLGAFVAAFQLGKLGDTLTALKLGASAGAGLYLLYQTFVGGILFAILGKIPQIGYVFAPVKLAYGLLVWPAVQLARMSRQLELLPAGGEPASAKAPARGGDMSGSCIFVGRVIALESFELHDSKWTRGETVLEIHRDWRVSSEKFRFWGWIDPSGAIREGTGPTDDADGPVLGELRDDALWVRGKRVGTFERELA